MLRNQNVYDVLQTVGYEDVLWISNCMGKTTALEIVIKIILTNQLS
jgi:hypothetical protein